MSTDPDTELAREICQKLAELEWKNPPIELRDWITQALRSVRQEENEAIAQFVDSQEFYIKPREQRATAIRNRMKEKV